MKSPSLAKESFFAAQNSSFARNGLVRLGFVKRRVKRIEKFATLINQIYAFMLSCGTHLPIKGTKMSVFSMRKFNIKTIIDAKAVFF